MQIHSDRLSPRWRRRPYADGRLVGIFNQFVWKRLVIAKSSANHTDGTGHGYDEAKDREDTYLAAFKSIETALSSGQWPCSWSRVRRQAAHVASRRHRARQPQVELSSPSHSQRLLSYNIERNSDLSRLQGERVCMFASLSSLWSNSLKPQMRVGCSTKGSGEVVEEEGVCNDNSRRCQIRRAGTDRA